MKKLMDIGMLPVQVLFLFPLVKILSQEPYNKNALQVVGKPSSD